VTVPSLLDVSFNYLPRSFLYFSLCIYVRSSFYMPLSLYLFPYFYMPLSATLLTVCFSMLLSLSYLFYTSHSLTFYAPPLPFLFKSLSCITLTNLIFLNNQSRSVYSLKDEVNRFSGHLILNRKNLKY